MMIRRRVERKAKLVATVLFKKMANVRDWNSDSQSISVKRAKQVSKSIAAMRADVMHSRPEVTVAFSDAPHFNSFMKMNEKVSPGTVPRPVHLRPSRKCKKRVDLSAHQQSVASCVRKSIKASSTKSKERKDVSRRSEKKEGVRICKPLKQDVRAPQIIGSLPSKHACKLEQNLGWKTGCRTPKTPSNSPKKYDGELSKKLSFSVRIENGKIASACGFTSKIEDTVIPLKKLVVSLRNDLGQSSRMIPQGLSTTLLADRFIISRELKDTCSITSTTQLHGYSGNRNADDRALIKEIFPAYDVTENRFPDGKSFAPNSLPFHEKRKMELSNNFFKSNTGKHQLDAFAFGDVCVKLTKLDEKNLVSGETKCSLEFQRPSSTFSSICNPAKCTESAFVWKKQRNAHLTGGDLVAYPTGRMEDFLKIIGLMKKSEIKKSDVTANKLHREAGGKLRRFLKPRLMSEVVYRRSNAASGVSPNGNFIRRGKDSFSGTINGASSSVKGKVKSNPTFRNTADKIALLEKQLKGNKRSPVILAGRLSADYNLSEFESNKFDSKSVVLDLTLESASKDKLVATDTKNGVQKTLDVHLTAVSKALTSKSGKQTLTNSICQSRKRTKTVPFVSMTTAVQNPDHSNTDEYEKRQKWEGDFESVKQTPSKHLPQEDDSMLIELFNSPASIDGRAKSDHFSASDGVTEMRETLWKGGKMANAPRLKNASHSSHLTSVGCKLSIRACQLSLRKTDRKNETRKETSFKHLEHLKVKTSIYEKKMTKQKDKEKLFTLAANDTGIDKPLNSKLGSYVLLSYWSKEADCIVPHMCSVCWVNDHMYCKNMKRTTSDLPAIGGCIHYIPCFHYMQQDMTATRQLSSDTRCHFECHRLNSASATGDGELQENLVGQHWNDKDLFCREEMLLFDWESPSVLQRETECPKVQLRSVCLAANSVVLEEVDTRILPEEFGSEVFIENPDSDILVELGLLENSSRSAHLGTQRLENEKTEPTNNVQNCGRILFG